MKTFRVGKVDTGNINTVLLETSKAFEAQSKRNGESYQSLYNYMNVLKNYVNTLDSLTQQAVYYKTFFQNILESHH